MRGGCCKGFTATAYHENCISYVSRNNDEGKRHDSLRYLLFLSKKRSGRIKGWGCNDDRNQRSYLSKEGTSLPTVAMESLMVSYSIDACEGRDIATIDIPCTFLQADMAGNIVDMKVEGTIADIVATHDDVSMTS